MPVSVRHSVVESDSSENGHLAAEGSARICYCLYSAWPLAGFGGDMMENETKWWN